MTASECKVAGLFKLNTPSVYKEISDLPSVKAVRSVQAGFIKNILANSEGTSEILSVGVGRGELYRNFLKKEFSIGKLRLRATECDESLATVAKDEFPGAYMDALTFAVLEPRYSTVMVTPEINLPDLPQQSLDFAELSFTMSSFMLKHDIYSFIQGIYRMLKPSGTMILADIDGYMGAYIESRLRTYCDFFKELTVDALRGKIVGTKHRRHDIPFMNINDSMPDLEVFERFFSRNITGFLEEIKRSLLPEAEDLATLELDAIKQGLRFYREMDEWLDITDKVFGEFSQIHVYTPDSLKKLYPEIKDYPFVIFAIKG